MKPERRQLGNCGFVCWVASHYIGLGPKWVTMDTQIKVPTAGTPKL